MRDFVHLLPIFTPSDSWQLKINQVTSYLRTVSRYFYFNHPTAQPSICQSLLPLRWTLIHPPSHSSILSGTHLYIQPSTHALIHPPVIHLFMQLPMCTSIFTYIYIYYLHLKLVAWDRHVGNWHMLKSGYFAFLEGYLLNNSWCLTLAQYCQQPSDYSLPLEFFFSSITYQFISN